MNIERFMQGYKAAWEGRDESMFCALFASDGIYRNTPFAAQHGHEQLAQYWQRIKLQDDIHLSYEILAAGPADGIAHWHVTYKVTSEELFRVWAASTGTNLVARKPGEVNFAHSAERQCIDERPRVPPMIDARDVHIVHVQEKAAACSVQNFA